MTVYYLWHFIYSIISTCIMCFDARKVWVLRIGEIARRGNTVGIYVHVTMQGKAKGSTQSSQRKKLSCLERDSNL